jgi:hypothetical protein
LYFLLEIQLGCTVDFYLVGMFSLTLNL